MAQFHFVEDYERHVANLKANYPLDEAMSLAVGGNYDRAGEIEMGLLNKAGLADGMSIFDLGCGSGRLANALAKSGLTIEYLGTDVVQDLLDYAASKTPPHYRFLRHPELSVPAEDGSIDIACAFSVFTHLLHHESYMYMADIWRALKPEGMLVFSFLEFAASHHWSVFEHTIEQQRASTTPHLNTFIERQSIIVWAEHLGFGSPRFFGDLGQTTAILRKP